MLLKVSALGNDADGDRDLGGVVVFTPLADATHHSHNIHTDDQYDYDSEQDVKHIWILRLSES